MKFFTEQIISYPGIGEVTYKRNLRARRLTIAIRQTKGVRVTIPGTLAFKNAESFVLSKSKWIVEKVNQLKAKDTPLFEDNGFRTKEHTLRFFPFPTDKIKVTVRNGLIDVYFPGNVDLRNPDVQAAATKGVEVAYRIEAKNYLPSRTVELAKKFDFKVNSVAVKRTTSRWGSCSARNNINLSIFLMKLPFELIDYIILHELCHTRHKNHGVRFWNELNRLTGGNAKELSKRVSEYGARV